MLSQLRPARFAVTPGSHPKAAPACTSEFLQLDEARELLGDGDGADYKKLHKKMHDYAQEKVSFTVKYKAKGCGRCEKLQQLLVVQLLVALAKARAKGHEDVVLAEAAILGVNEFSLHCRRTPSASRMPRGCCRLGHTFGRGTSRRAGMGICRCSCTWANAGGQREAALEVIRTLWRHYLDLVGLAVGDCPIAGLFAA